MSRAGRFLPYSYLVVVVVFVVSEFPCNIRLVAGNPACVLSFTPSVHEGALVGLARAVVRS